MKRINDPKCFSATALFISYSIILSFTKTSSIIQKNLTLQLPDINNLTHQSCSRQPATKHLLKSYSCSNARTPLISKRGPPVPSM